MFFEIFKLVKKLNSYFLSFCRLYFLAFETHTKNINPRFWKFFKLAKNYIRAFMDFFFSLQKTKSMFLELFKLAKKLKAYFWNLQINDKFTFFFNFLILQKIKSWFLRFLKLVKIKIMFFELCISHTHKKR